jgi:glycosyltransferase involved in cell wall biosynthesis
MADLHNTKNNHSRVIMLLPGLDNVGGAELQAWRLATSLKRLEQPVHLVGPGTRRMVLKHLERFHISDPPTFTPIPTLFKVQKRKNRLWGYIHKASFFIAVFIWLFRNRNHYDIVHGHLLSQTVALCGLTSLLWKKSTIVKVGSIGPASDFDKGVGGPLRSINRWLVGYIDCFVNISDAIANDLIKVLKVSQSKVHHIPNGINVLKFSPPSHKNRQAIRQQIGLPSDSNIVLFAGRLEPTKRVELLLRAWQRIPKNHNAILLIAGNGKMESELKTLCRKLNIEHRVRFHGISSEIHLVMQAADLFVLPSLTEGMPNVLLEALATGLPVIVTKMPAYTGFIKHLQNGYLFEDKGPEPLASAINHLLQNKDLAKQLGSTGRITVEQRYNLTAVTSRYVQLYQNIADQK